MFQYLYFTAGVGLISMTLHAYDCRQKLLPIRLQQGQLSGKVAELRNKLYMASKEDRVSKNLKDAIEVTHTMDELLEECKKMLV